MRRVKRLPYHKLMAFLRSRRVRIAQVLVVVLFLSLLVLVVKDAGVQHDATVKVDATGEFFLAEDHAGPLVYPIYETCEEHLANADSYANVEEQERLRKVFGRFRNVKDQHEGDTAPHTAEVRFIMSCNSLNYSYVLPFVLSAQVSGIPIDVLGVQDDRVKDHFYKWLYLEEFARITGLQDHDVIVMFDTDIYFIGEDVLPVMEEFLATTPRSAAEMDVQKVRAHQMRPPFYMGTEMSCWLQLVMSMSASSATMSLLESLRESWADDYNAQLCGGGKPWKVESNTNFQRNNRMGPNSGSLAVRVWALKEVLRSVRIFISHRSPVFSYMGSIMKWKSDQAILGGILLELMLWEHHCGVLSPCVNRSTEEFCEEAPYQLTPGVIGLDYQQDITLSIMMMDRALLNGKLLEFDAMPLVINEVFDQIVEDYRTGMGDRAKRSPCGVPLAPVSILSDERSNQGRYYKNLPLDGSKGPIDVSIPHPDGHSIAWHYNGQEAVKTVLELYYAKIVPWFLPLYAEGWRRNQAGPVDPQKQPQMHAILNVMANSPSIRIWLPDSSDINKQHYKLSLNSTYATANMSDICRQHPSSLPQV